MGTPLLLRKQIEKNGRDTYIAKDGVHLKMEAHKLIAGAVLDFLEENKATS
jgi:lysophospholipase L1-like esterase